MSQEQTNIALGARGCVEGVVIDMLTKATVFHNFLNVSQGLLASIVVGKVLAKLVNQKHNTTFRVDQRQKTRRSLFA